MTTIQREIVKKAGCDVLDHSINGFQEIKKDITKRINRQEKTLKKAIEKGWDTFVIEDGLEKLKRTLAVI